MKVFLSKFFKYKWINQIEKCWTIKQNKQINKQSSKQADKEQQKCDLEIRIKNTYILLIKFTQVFKEKRNFRFFFTFNCFFKNKINPWKFYLWWFKTNSISDRSDTFITLKFYLFEHSTISNLITLYRSQVSPSEKEGENKKKQTTT